MRSFSNLWYWIGLAVIWSTASHWVLGVPFDLVQRAERQGGQAEIDLADLVRINVNRILYVIDRSGHWMVALTAAYLAVLVTLGFFYDVEFAQALLFLTAPMVIVAIMNIWTGHRIRSEAAQGETLRKIIARHRLKVQILGAVSIFITSLFGMAQNMLVIGPLGG